jgi:NADH pyrophosphatase NudC (nudix superfamily)
MTKLLRIKRKNSFVDVWVMTADIEVDGLTLQKSEVAEVKWVTMSELDEMIAKGEFHNYGDEYFDTLKERIEDYRGAFV